LQIIRIVITKTLITLHVEVDFNIKKVNFRVQVSMEMGKISRKIEIKQPISTHFGVLAFLS